MRERCARGRRKQHAATTGQEEKTYSYSYSRGGANNRVCRVPCGCKTGTECARARAGRRRETETFARVLEYSIIVGAGRKIGGSASISQANVQQNLHEIAADKLGIPWGAGALIGWGMHCFIRYQTSRLVLGKVIFGVSGAEATVRERI